VQSRAQVGHVSVCALSNIVKDTAEATTAMPEKNMQGSSGRCLMKCHKNFFSCCYTLVTILFE